MYTSSCSLYHTSALSGFLHIVNSSPFPGSVFWSTSFSTQLLPTPVDAHHGLRSKRRYPSVLLKTGYCSPLSLWSYLSVPPDLPTGEEAYQGEETIHLSQFSTGGAWPVLNPLSFILSSYVEIFLAILAVWDFSASVQQVFGENCSTCRYAFDVFVGGGEFNNFYSTILIGVTFDILVSQYFIFWRLARILLSFTED